MAEEIVLDAAKYAKEAKRAALLTALATVVAVVVLLLDQTIKRQILIEADKARTALDELLRTVPKKEAGDGGTTAAGEAGSPPGPSVNGAGGVVNDAPAREAVGETGGPPQPAASRGPAGQKRGTAGNGRRTVRKA